MLRSSPFLLSIGVHATLFGVVGVLTMRASGDADPELLAGDAAASGSFAMTTRACDPDAELLPELPAPTSPFQQELPQAEERPLDDVPLPPSLEPLPFEAVEVTLLDEVLPCSDAEGGALLPFAFEPVASRLLPLKLGPSRIPASEPLVAAAPQPGPPAPSAPQEPSPQPEGSMTSQAHTAGVADTLFAPSSYPRRAVARRIEGTVVLLAQVGADGLVRSCEIESSSGSELLDEAARTSLLRWRFKPRRVDGVDCAFIARVPFQFILPKEEPAERGGMVAPPPATATS